MNMTSINHKNNADFADFGIEGDEEKPFPVQCLPPAAQSYLHEICQLYGVVPELPGACMLGTLSMALGSAAELHTGKHVVRGNLYVLGAAPSGGSKSTVFNRVVQPLMDYQKKVVKHWRENELPATNAKIKMLNHRQEALSKQSSKQTGNPDSSLQELTVIEQQLQELQSGLEEPCLVVGEATREKLVEMMSHCRRETLATASAEARGCMNTLMGRYNKTTDEDVFVAVWTGDFYKLSRIKRPSTTLDKPCLSLLWLVQPDLMEKFLAVDSMNESGLLARMLPFAVSAMVHAKFSEASLTTQPSGEEWSKLVTWVAGNANRRDQPAQMFCDPKVVELMTDLDARLKERQRPGGDLGEVSIFAARWVEQAWRIMLVLHVANLYSGVVEHVSIETARRAIKIADWFATQQMLLLTNRREIKRDERFDELTAILQRKQDNCCSLRDMRRRHRFQEDEVRKIVEDNPNILELIDLKPNGPGRPSQCVRLKA